MSIIETLVLSKNYQEIGEKEAIYSDRSIDSGVNAVMISIQKRKSYERNDASDYLKLLNMSESIRSLAALIVEGAVKKLSIEQINLLLRIERIESIFQSKILFSCTYAYLNNSQTTPKKPIENLVARAPTNSKNLAEAEPKPDKLKSNNPTKTVMNAETFWLKGITPIVPYIEDVEKHCLKSSCVAENEIQILSNWVLEQLRNYLLTGKKMIIEIGTVDTIQKMPLEDQAVIVKIIWDVCKNLKEHEKQKIINNECVSAVATSYIFFGYALEAVQCHIGKQRMPVLREDFQDNLRLLSQCKTNDIDSWKVSKTAIAELLGPLEVTSHNIWKLEYYLKESRKRIEELIILPFLASKNFPCIMPLTHQQMAKAFVFMIRDMRASEHEFTVPQIITELPKMDEQIYQSRYQPLWKTLVELLLQLENYQAEEGFEEKFSQLLSIFSQTNNPTLTPSQIPKTEIVVASSASVTLVRERECVICAEELKMKKEMVFLPCRHIGHCSECANQIASCSICREVIAQKMIILDPVR